MLELSVIRKDLWASTLVGLNWENPVPDPLAVQHLDNLLYIWEADPKIPCVGMKLLEYFSSDYFTTFCISTFYNLSQSYYIFSIKNFHEDKAPLNRIFMSPFLPDENKCLPLKLFSFLIYP